MSVWRVRLARSAERDLAGIFVVFRVVEEQTIDVLRVLHDSMDLPAHLSSDDFQN